MGSLWRARQETQWQVQTEARQGGLTGLDPLRPLTPGGGRCDPCTISPSASLSSPSEIALLLPRLGLHSCPASSWKQPGHTSLPRSPFPLPAAFLTKQPQGRMGTPWQTVLVSQICLGPGKTGLISSLDINYIRGPWQQNMHGLWGLPAANPSLATHEQGN